MPKMTKKGLGKAGTIIMAEAKAIRKQNPQMEWRQCVALAGKKYHR